MKAMSKWRAVSNFLKLQSVCQPHVPAKDTLEHLFATTTHLKHALLTWAFFGRPRGPFRALNRPE